MSTFWYAETTEDLQNQTSPLSIIITENPAGEKSGTKKSSLHHNTQTIQK